MGHMLFSNDRMFSVREAPWHYDETGDRVALPDEYLGREESMRLAGHDFTIAEYPHVLATLDGTGASLRMVDGWKALVNEKSGAVVNMARDSYTVVQNDLCWDIVDAIVDQPSVKYETGGTLKGGAVCWVLARLDEPFMVPGDDSPTMPYVCVQWSHDGSGAVQARSTNIRVVCWNTLSASEYDARNGKTNFTFRHTGRVMERIEEAKQYLRGVRAETSAFAELATELARIPVSDEGIEEFVRQFIPAPPTHVVISDRVLENITEARHLVRSLFDGDTINADIRNTAWGLVQAGTEYLDHLRGFRNHRTYLGRTLLKEEPLKAKLIPLVRRVAEKAAA